MSNIRMRFDASKVKRSMYCAVLSVYFIFVFSGKYEATV